jgi:hypothetical protein
MVHALRSSPCGEAKLVGKWRSLAVLARFGNERFVSSNLTFPTIYSSYRGEAREKSVRGRA